MNIACLDLPALPLQLVWRDDGPEPPAFEAFVPLIATQNGAAGGTGGVGGGTAQWPEPDVTLLTPTVQEVASLERTRTVDEGGVEQPVFTADTRPTDVEAQLLIDEAVPVVLAQLRPTFPASYYDQVSHLIALYAAILIEGSFFREQLNEGAVALWRVLYTTGMTAVVDSIEAEFQSAASTGLRLP